MNEMLNIFNILQQVEVMSPVAAFWFKSHFSMSAGVAGYFFLPLTSIHKPFEYNLAVMLNA